MFVLLAALASRRLGSGAMVLLSALAPANAAKMAIPAAQAGRADSYYLYCLSQQALIRRDFGEALRFLEEASRADPNAPLLAAELARVYLNLNETDRAVAESARATALDPNALEPRRILVDAYRSLLSSSDKVDEDLFARAVAAHIDLLARDPDDNEVRMSLARLYLARGLYMQAAEILKTLVNGDPASVEGIYLLSQALTRSGSPEEAKGLLDAGLKDHPGQIDLLRALVDALDALGDLQEASRVLQQVVAAVPDRYEYRFSLARLYEKMKDPKSAAEQAALIIRALRGSSPGSNEEAEARAASMLLIEATAETGDVDRAIASALFAEKEFPEEERFPLKRAELLLLNGREEDAETVLKSVSSLTGPGSAGPGAVSEIYLRAGARMEEKGDVTKAESFLRRAIEIDPTNHSAMNYLGYLFADRGVELDKSLALITRAVELDADNGAYLDSLGWVLFKLGRYTQAEDPLLRAARLIPGEAVVHDHLGDLYLAEGRPSDAVRSWREALRLSAENPDAIKKKIDQATSPQPATP